MPFGLASELWELTGGKTSSKRRNAKGTGINLRNFYQFLSKAGQVATCKSRPTAGVLQNVVTQVSIGRLTSLLGEFAPGISNRS
jgi:hypothetical protein